jgi:hypothetical protein
MNASFRDVYLVVGLDVQLDLFTSEGSYFDQHDDGGAGFV